MSIPSDIELLSESQTYSARSSHNSLSYEQKLIQRLELLLSSREGVKINRTDLIKMGNMLRLYQAMVYGNSVSMESRLHAGKFRVSVTPYYVSWDSGDIQADIGILGQTHADKTGFCKQCRLNADRRCSTGHVKIEGPFELLIETLAIPCLNGTLAFVTQD